MTLSPPFRGFQSSVLTVLLMRAVVLCTLLQNPSEQPTHGLARVRSTESTLFRGATYRPFNEPTCISYDNANWTAPAGSNFTGASNYKCYNVLAGILFPPAGINTTETYTFFQEGLPPPPQPRPPIRLRMREVPFRYENDVCSVIVAMRRQWPKGLVPGDEEAYGMPEVAQISHLDLWVAGKALWKKCYGHTIYDDFLPGYIAAGKASSL